MAIYGQTITVAYLAWNYTSGGGQTGDASNHTVKLLKDGTEAAATNSPSEIDATNMPGWYSLALTSTEMSHNYLVVGGKSATSGVALFGPCIATDQGVLPGGHLAGAASGLLVNGATAAGVQMDSSGYLKVSNGTGVGQISLSSGVVAANATQLDGQSVSASGAVTFPSGTVGTSTLTQAQVTGGAYALNTDSSGNVKISSGTGANQINLNSGVADANLKQILGTASAGAAGYVALDWSQVHAATATVNLSGTTIEAVSGSVGSVTGNVAGSVGSVTGAVEVGSYASGKDPATLLLITPGNLIYTDADGFVKVDGTLNTLDALAAHGDANWGSGTSFALREGAAQGGASSTLTLDTGSSADDNAYVGGTLVITAGTGSGQAASIAGYAGATKVATIYGSWGTTPDDTSSFAVYPQAPVAVQYGTSAGQISATAGVVNTNAVSFGGQALTVPSSGGIAIPGAVGTSTLTQAQVTGGSYALQTDGSGYLKISSGSGQGQVSLNAGAVVVNSLTSNAFGEFFTVNSGQTFATAVHGSIVYEAGANTTVIGSVTVGGYTTGQDPATYVLATPGNKLATDSSGRVPANLVEVAGQTVTAPGSGGVAFPGSVGTSTLTQVEVTGGAYALQTDGSGYLKISSGTGTGQISLSSGAVTAGALAANAITAAAIESGAISSTAFAAGAITSSAFASGAVGAAAMFEVDGLAIDSAMSAILATILGVTNVSGNQVEFMHQDGETTKVTVTYGTEAGQRTGSVVGT